WVRRCGAVRVRLPGGSTPIATGRRNRPRGGPAPAVPGGTARAPVCPVGTHGVGGPVPAAPGFPAARRNRIPGQVSWACSSSVSPVLGGKPVRRLVAADRTASVRVTAVRWRLGRVKQRVAGPHVINVIDSKVRMLEQVRGLGVDLKRVFLIQQVQIEPLTAHLIIVLQTT